MVRVGRPATAGTPGVHRIAMVVLDVPVRRVGRPAAIGGNRATLGAAGSALRRPAGAAIPVRQPVRATAVTAGLATALPAAAAAPAIVRSARGSAATPYGGLIGRQIARPRLGISRRGTASNRASAAPMIAMPRANDGAGRPGRPRRTHTSVAAPGRRLRIGIQVGSAETHPGRTLAVIAGSASRRPLATGGNPPRAGLRAPGGGHLAARRAAGQRVAAQASVHRATRRASVEAHGTNATQRIVVRDGRPINGAVPTTPKPSTRRPAAPGRADPPNRAFRPTPIRDCWTRRCAPSCVHWIKRPLSTWVATWSPQAG